ncbi:MAG: protein translocase SEC61 complex subunit gamma [Candidatus Aenigmatarchaeota archaeon]
MGLKETIENWKRVLQIARKPDKFEFTTTSKICAIGLVLIGFIGFVIFMISILACSFGGFCL